MKRTLTSNMLPERAARAHLSRLGSPSLIPSRGTKNAAPVSQRSWVQIPYGPEFFQVLFTTTRFSSVLSCEDLLISSLHRSANMWIFIYLKSKFLIFVQCRRWSRQKRQETVKVDVLQTQLAFFSSSWEKWVILHFCPSEIFLLYSKYFIDQACLVKKAE